MKITDLNRALKTLDGKPIPDGRPVEKGEDFVALTLKDVCMNALLAFDPNGKMTGKDKFERYSTAVKLQEAETEVELGAEDVVKIKECVGILYSPLIVGQVWNMLEK